MCSMESSVYGWVAHGHVSSLTASSSWCSPHQLPPAFLSCPCREQGLKQTGHLPDTFCPVVRVLVLVPPLVLTRLMCLYVCAYTCTFVYEWEVFVGSSFDIWFSTYFLVNFFSLHSFPTRVIYFSNMPKPLFF